MERGTSDVTPADTMPSRTGPARAPATPLALAIGLVLAAPALGASILLSPAVPFLALAGGAFVWLCFVAPAWAFAAYAFAHLAIPIYLRPPAIGPLPAPPIALAMLVVLALCVVVRGLATVRPARPWGGRSKAALGFFLAFALVAALSLCDERTTTEGVNMWVKAFAFPLTTLLVAASALEGRDDVVRTFDALLAAAVVISLYAIYEFYVGHNDLLETYLIPIGGDEDWSEFYFTGDALGPGIAYRSFSVFSQPIEFATCVGMIYPYAVVRFGNAKGAGRLLFGLAAAICLVGLSTSFSRTAVAAALLATIIAGVVVPALRKWFAAGVVFLSLVLLVSWPLLGERVSERLNDVDNVTLRTKLWETAIHIFVDHPVLGVGFGNYPQYYLQAMRDHLVAPATEFGASSVERIRVAENFYLQLAAETGVIGLAAFCAFALASAWLIIGLLRAGDVTVRRLGVAIALGAMVYFLNAATVTAYTHFSSTLTLLGFLFPLAITLDRRPEGAQKETAP